MAEDETRAVLNGLADVAVLLALLRSEVAALQAELPEMRHGIAELQEQTAGFKDDIMGALERVRERIR
jgi:hypothetical protein